MNVPTTADAIARKGQLIGRPCGCCGSYSIYNMGGWYLCSWCDLDPLWRFKRGT